MLKRHCYFKKRKKKKASSRFKVQASKCSTLFALCCVNSKGAKPLTYSNGACPSFAGSHTFLLYNRAAHYNSQSIGMPTFCLFIYA